MRVVFSFAARRDLAEAVAYISVDNPAAAQRQFDLVQNAASRLAEFPLLDARMTERRPRFQVARAPFRLIYSVHEDFVEILHVWHGAREWPPRSR